jgi:hypothetical protein
MRSVTRATQPDRAGKGRAGYLPSPQEIRQACLEIQAGWSPRERALRWTGPRRQRWEFPLVAARDLFGGHVDDEGE